MRPFMAFASPQSVHCMSNMTVILNVRPITVAVVSMNEAQAPTSVPLFSTPESAHFYHTSSPSCADRHCPRVVRSTGRSTTSMLRLCCLASCFEFELLGSCASCGAVWNEENRLNHNKKMLEYYYLQPSLPPTTTRFGRQRVDGLHSPIA